MTNIEVNDLKAALQHKRLELMAQLRGRVRELSIEDGQTELIDRVQSMSGRDETALMLNRFSSTLAEVDRSLRAMDEHRYGDCIRCHRPIAVKRLQSIPWAPYCVRCQERIEAAAEDPDALDFDEFDEPQAA